MIVTSARELTEQPTLGSHQQAWDELVDQAALPSPFLRSWWLEHTCRGRPIFLLLLDGSTLVGGLAMQERRTWGVRRLELIGNGSLVPDHLDLVAQPGRENDVADAVVTWLRDRKHGIIDFDGLAQDAHLAKCVDHVELRLVDESAPYLDLPRDWETLFASRSSKVKKTVKAPAARLKRMGIEHRTLGADHIDQALDELEQLHRLRFGEDSSFIAEYARFRAAASAGMARGEVVVHELVAGEEPIAAMVVMRVAGRASYYQSGRRTETDWRGAGTLVFTDAVASAIEAGCTEFDLLRGGETYKYGWSTGERDVVRLIGSAGRRRVPARALALSVGARRRLRPGVGHARQRAGQARAWLRTAVTGRPSKPGVA